MRAKHAPVALLFCLALSLAAGAGIAAAPAERIFALDIAGGAVPASQRVIRVQKGDALRLRVSSDAAGELHLHGYRVQAKLLPGTPAELAFTAFASGRYAIEWHDAKEAAAPAGKAAGHHRAPLATLEVLPK